MDKWYFDDIDTNLRHRRGKFYSIESIKVTTNYGETQRWDLPIINQPVIGILCILTKVVGGGGKIFNAGKIETRNIDVLQLLPISSGNGK